MRTTGKRRKQKTELVQTGLEFEVVEGETTNVAGHEFTSVQYPVDGLPCPECADGKIFFGFEVGERCPWCDNAELEFGPIIY